MDKVLALEVLGKAFNISDIAQLEKDTEYSQITKNRVKLDKTNDCRNRQIMRSVSRGMYEYAADVLSKYGTEEMVERYKADNKKVYEPSLTDWLANKFIIDSDYDALHKYVASNYRSRYDMFEFDDVTYNGKTYWIAWD